MTQRHVRTGVLVSAVVVAGTVAACGSSTAAAGSCVGAVLSAHPGEEPPEPGNAPSLGAVGRGQQITLYGRRYFAPCQDTVRAGGTLAPASPLSSVRLTLEAGGHEWDIGTAHPNAAAGFTVTATVPTDAPLGPAEVRDDQGNAVTLVVADGG